MKEYKCEYYDGCGFSTTINGIELVNLSKNDIETILKPILCYFAQHHVSVKDNSENYADLIIDGRDFGAFDDGYDDRYMEDFNKAKSEYTIDKLINEIKKVKDLAVLQMMFQDYMRYFGEEEDLGFCEQCGSYNESYTYTVNL